MYWFSGVFSSMLLNAIELCKLILMSYFCHKKVDLLIPSLPTKYIMSFV